MRGRHYTSNHAGASRIPETETRNGVGAKRKPVSKLKTESRTRTNGRKLLTTINEVANRQQRETEPTRT